MVKATDSKSVGIFPHAFKDLKFASATTLFLPVFVVAHSFCMLNASPYNANSHQSDPGTNCELHTHPTKIARRLRLLYVRRASQVRLVSSSVRASQVRPESKSEALFLLIR